MTAIRLGTSFRAPHNVRSNSVPSVGCADEVGDVDELNDESDLVRRLIAGDAFAWRTFVDQFHRLVTARIAATARELRVTLRPSDGEDLTADVFSQLLARDCASLRDFQGRSTLSTWLSVIARRIALRKLLGARREPANPLYAAPADRELAAQPLDDPLVHMIRNENRRRLDEALAELSERQRELVRLHYLDGCSYREISQRLGMSINSIGPTLQRVQEKLRARLQS